MIADFTLRSEHTGIREGQTDTGNRIRSIVKWDACKWIMGIGSDRHIWRVSCNEAEAVVLSLMAEKVSYTYYHELLATKALLEKDLADLKSKIAVIDKELGLV